MKTIKKNKLLRQLKKGARDGVFPGAVLLVAKRAKVLLFEAIGYRICFPERLPMEKDTIFDMASLTKPLATTLGIMKLVDRGQLSLDQPLIDILGISLPDDKRFLTPRLLLSHTSGLPDWRPYYLILKRSESENRKKIVREWILNEPLMYQPGCGCLYSDLGFMVLEWIIEHTSGMSMPQFLKENIYGPLLLKHTSFSGASPIKKDKKKLFAATELCPWRKMVLQGEVHDDNAFTIGGYSGHAGLFSTAEEVYSLANMLREHYLGLRQDFFKPELVKLFFQKQTMLGGCTRTLGWDTPSSRNSRSGRYFSKKSVGHLGYTGTSIWIDFKRDVIVILLTNRVHLTRENWGIKRFRPFIHNKIMETVCFLK